jgi:mRNA interferase MazF
MFDAYDVVVVPFPYSDRLAEKRRPALVVSNPALAHRHGRVWVAMITTAPADQLGDTTIADLAPTGLPAPSTLRAGKIATIEAARVLRKIGTLSEADANLARQALAACAAF